MISQISVILLVAAISSAAVVPTNTKPENVSPVISSSTPAVAEITKAVPIQTSTSAKSDSTASTESVTVSSTSTESAPIANTSTSATENQPQSTTQASSQAAAKAPSKPKAAEPEPKDVKSGSEGKEIEKKKPVAKPKDDVVKHTFEHKHEPSVEKSAEKPIVFSYVHDSPLIISEHEDLSDFYDDDEDDDDDNDDAVFHHNLFSY